MVLLCCQKYGDWSLRTLDSKTSYYFVFIGPVSFAALNIPHRQWGGWWCVATRLLHLGYICLTSALFHSLVAAADSARRLGHLAWPLCSVVTLGCPFQLVRIGYWMFFLLFILSCVIFVNIIVTV